MDKRTSVRESIERALQHNVLSGVLSDVSPPGPGQPKWRISFKSATVSQSSVELTTSEARLFCIALAASALRWRPPDVPTGMVSYTMLVPDHGLCEYAGCLDTPRPASYLIDDGSKVCVPCAAWLSSTGHLIKAIR